MEDKSSLIFIMIASYRDPQLIPTIRDCIDKSKYPERLRFGICRQYAKMDIWDHKYEFENDPRFKWDDVLWNRSEGCCWSRSKGQQFYDGEKYYMQLDSHMRFAYDWDVGCIEMLDGLRDAGSEKPLLTSYVGGYDPLLNWGGNDWGMINLDPAPCRMVFYKWTDDGIPLNRPQVMEGWQNMKSPEPAAWLSAHFIFTYGTWVEEVPYDPELYFHGEEPSLAARSYTHGWDLFHPHINPCWHEYTRKYRVDNKHWDDHGGKNAGALAETWNQRNRKSYDRFNVLFEQKENPDIDIGEYGFGDVRTLEDYGRLCGLDFKRRSVGVFDDHGVLDNSCGGKIHYNLEDFTGRPAGGLGEMTSGNTGAVHIIDKQDYIQKSEI